MSGVLSFLFDGKPPPSVTTYGTSTTNVPQWLSDYTQGVVNQANSIAGQPYQPYTGERIAGLTPEQQQAYSLVENNVGKGSGVLGGAIDMTNGVLGEIAPTIGTNMANASKTYTGDTVGRYMNPYVQNVTKQAQNLANRNFNENLLPIIQNTFTRAGQYGSTRMADAVGHAARNTSEALQSAADADLANAYTAGAQTFGSDASRASTLAQLGVNGALTGSSNLGNLGDTLQKLGLADASSLESIGASKQGLTQKSLDTAYNDFLAQRDYPKNQTDWLANIIHGTSNTVPTSTTDTKTAPYSGDMQPSVVGSLGSLLSLWNAIKSDNGG